jgi:squalene-associated FAD-dependent desaturase
MSKSLKPHVAIIGAGYAGMACAVELADAGCHVEVFEASRTLGGRARAVTLDGMTVDNGMHLIIGAYRETLRLMQKVDALQGGRAEDALMKPLRSRTVKQKTLPSPLRIRAVADGETVFLRRSLRLEFPGHFGLAAAYLPAPLHLAWALLTAGGLTWHEKFAAMRFMRALEKCHFRLPRDITAKQLIATQPATLRRFLWEPLCLAALNTPVAEASAQVFLNVLRDSLAADRAAADLLLSTVNLSDLFPEPAARFVEAHGGTVHRSRRIGALDELAHFDHRVIAVAPQHLAALAADIAARYPFDWQPIATIYLRYPEAVGLNFPLLGMSGRHGQWVFDRGHLTGQPGLLAVVISGNGAWQSLAHDQLANAVHGELAQLLPNLPAPLQHGVIVDKRATFACVPNLARPATATADPTLWLAGDYIAGDYPATLEGAVRSGIAAAREILAAP